MNPILVNPIGVVRSEAKNPVDEGWGDVVSAIELAPWLAGALDGLEGFSHALIIAWLHQSPPPTGNRRHPRGRDDLPAVGILAQRARHRPNPIAVTAVKVVEVGPTRLVVRGLDAIDGTPVLDIKPYFPIYDRRDATTPSWVDELMKGYFG